MSRTLEVHELRTNSANVGATAVNKYRFVKFDADGNIVQAGAGEYAEGVAMDNGAPGELIRYMELGVHPVSVAVAAAFAKGDKIMSNADGRAVEATGVGAFVLGILQETATGDLELASAWINTRDITQLTA